MEGIFIFNYVKIFERRYVKCFILVINKSIGTSFLLFCSNKQYFLSDIMFVRCYVSNALGMSTGNSIAVSRISRHKLIFRLNQCDIRVCKVLIIPATIFSKYKSKYVYVQYVIYTIFNVWLTFWFSASRELVRWIHYKSNLSQR